MPKTSLIIFVGLIILTLLIPTPSPIIADSAHQIGVARLRFANATSVGSPINANLNGDNLAAQLRLSTDYIALNTGTYQLEFTDTNGQTLAAQAITLTAASRWTVALIGDVSSYQILAIEDNSRPTTRNNARLQIVHALPDSPAAPIYLGDTQWLNSLDFATSSPSQALVAGSYSLRLGPVSAQRLTLSPDRDYLVFITGTASNPRLLTLVAQPLRISSANALRVINMVEGAAYDVEVNQAPTFSNIQFRRSTASQTLAAGDYTLDLHPIGDATTTLASLNLSIQPNESLFVIISGPSTAPEMHLYADNLAPVPVNTARLQVIHLAPNLPDFSVQTHNSIQLIEQLSLNGISQTDLAGGNYAFDLIDASNPNQRVGYADAVISSGNLHTLIIYGDPTQRYVSFSQPLAQVALGRFVHASPQTEAIDLYLNDNILLSNMAYGDRTEHLSFIAGRYQLSVYPHGSNPNTTPAIFSNEIFINSDSLAFTFALIGGPHPRIDSYADNLEMIPTGKARIRFIHGALNVPSLSIINGADNRNLAAGLAFGQGSFNLDVNANTRVFYFNHVGAGIIYRIEAFPLTAGAAYTFIFTGDASQPDSLDYLLLSQLP